MGKDFLLAVADALPPELLDKSLPHILDDLARRDPAYWLTPATSAAVAALLGIEPGSLANWRCRAEKPGYAGPPPPPGWRYVEGVGPRYGSRLEVLRWYRETAGLARRAA